MARKVKPESKYWKDQKQQIRAGGLKLVRFVSGAETDKREWIQDDERYQLIIEYIKEHGLKFCGDEHQSDNFNGIPLFNDGTISVYTMREWGWIMAEVWGGTYIDWYLKGGM